MKINEIKKTIAAIENQVMSLVISDCIKNPLIAAGFIKDYKLNDHNLFYESLEEFNISSLLDYLEYLCDNKENRDFINSYLNIDFTLISDSGRYDIGTIKGSELKLGKGLNWWKIDSHMINMDLYRLKDQLRSAKATVKSLLKFTKLPIIEKPIDDNSHAFRPAYGEY
tara:strand:- start:244 stop:747 length:504 start_codon:yes stop_codon:yes gene_type:complete